MAIALGVALAFRHLRGGRMPVAGIVHGIIGATGTALLMIALRGPRRGDAMGVGSFGVAASVLLCIALSIGLLARTLYERSSRFTGFAIATHATVAITAFVLLLAWALLG